LGLSFKQYAAVVLFEQDEGATLLEMQTLLANARYRENSPERIAQCLEELVAEDKAVKVNGKYFTEPPIKS
jgi:hypothetical protein